MSKSVVDKYKKAFFSGLGALLPTILTVFVLSFCYTFLSDKVASPINSMIVELLSTDVAKDYYWKDVLHFQPYQLDEKLDESLSDDVLFSSHVAAHVPQWLGFLIAVTLVFMVGFLFSGYIGRQIWRALERWVQRLPVLKIIYPYAKQVTEFFFSEKKQINYDSVVALEYPRKGVYSLGFVTSEGFRDIAKLSGEDIVAIFIPSSPTPVTGYTIMIKKSETIAIDISVDEALRFTISGGVILPPGQANPVSLKTRKMKRPVISLEE